MMMTGALSLLICSVLLVTITIDHPFAGPVRVLPKPLSGVLAADRFNGFWKD